MPDREKTISDLQRVVAHAGDALAIDGLILNPFVIIPLMKDALALLKEQDEQIRIKTENFNRLVAKVEVMPEIVRCKDCKHYEMPKFGEFGYCNQNRMVTKTIWYCADGERS